MQELFIIKKEKAGFSPKEKDPAFSKKYFLISGLDKIHALFSHFFVYFPMASAKRPLSDAIPASLHSFAVSAAFPPPDYDPPLAFGLAFLSSFYSGRRRPPPWSLFLPGETRRLPVPPRPPRLPWSACGTYRSLYFDSYLFQSLFSLVLPLHK